MGDGAVSRRRTSIPKWVSYEARELFDESALNRMFGPSNPWWMFQSDEDRGAILDYCAFFAGFVDVDLTDQTRPRPSDSRKLAGDAASSLRAAAQKLQRAGEAVRVWAGLAGVTAGGLRAGAEVIDRFANTSRFRSLDDIRKQFMDGLSAQVKTRTGRYHDSVVARLTDLMFGSDFRTTANAVKALRHKKKFLT